jgi:hypothetical protein
VKHYSASSLQRLAAPPLLEEAELVAQLRGALDGTAAAKTRLAARLRVSEATLSRLLRGKLPIGGEVAERLGLRRVIRFEKIS